MATGARQRAVCAEVIRLLREERERQRLTKYAVAGRTGLTQQTIGYVERGLKLPSFETVLRLADGLDIDLADVIRKATAAVPESARER